MTPKKITRYDLVENVYYKTKIGRKIVKRIFEYLLREMIEALENGSTIEIRGFGTFEQCLRNRKISYNPQTGEKITMNPYYKVKFKPGIELDKEMRKIKTGDNNDRTE
jgi:nucleoid DNA-binding protein